ncbi:MAG: galactokinase [Balneolaceae bacterium]
MSELLDNIAGKFLTLYKSSPLLVESPGRVNLIGDHTDYNDGLVLPATINKSINLGLAPNQIHRIRAYSIDLNESVEMNLNHLEKSDKQWFNYIKGIVIELDKIGVQTQGFDIVFGGDIPIGAGLSSSAALEGAVLTGLNEVFELNLTKGEMAKIGQLTEHNHIGVNCGIMDQFVNLHGQQNAALLLDCRSLGFKVIPFNRKDIKIVICNSRVSHNLASSEYNLRRTQCEEGAELLRKYDSKIVNLRDVSFELLEKHKDELATEVYNRCKFVLDENKRVIDASKCLLSSDFLAFGKIMFQSHQGLSEEFEVSCNELNTLVEIAKGQKGVLGSRMMGGGFGGCTINLVEDQYVGNFCENIFGGYKERMGLEAEIYITQINSGAKVLEADLKLP